MTNRTNRGFAFPGLDLQTPGSADVYAPNHSADIPAGVGVIGQLADHFGKRLQDMALEAATREGQAQAAADARAGTLSPQNRDTAFGQAYDAVARDALKAERRAALNTQMGGAFAKYQANPAELQKAFAAIRAGTPATGFADLDVALDGDFQLLSSDFMTRSAEVVRRATVEQAQANFRTTLTHAQGLLDQTASGASFDEAGAGRVAGAYTAFVRDLARYGPREAFEVGGVRFEADATRSGALSPETIAAAAIQADTQARSVWVTSQADRIATPEGKRAFGADLRRRWEAGDPAFSTLDGASIERLANSIEADADRLETDDRAVKGLAGQRARDALEALTWGGEVDRGQLVADAHASGDAGLIAQAELFAKADPNALLRPDAAGLLGVAPDADAWFGAGAVAASVRATASAQGATPQEQRDLLLFGQIESGMRPNVDKGTSQGLFQFQPAAWAEMGGGDIRSVHDQTVNALKRYRQGRDALAKRLGRQPTTAEIYLYHQQGPGGGPALITAPRETNAIAALAPAYGGDVNKARAAIIGNGGTETMTAGEFVDLWSRKLARRGASIGGAPDAFIADPLDYARGTKDRRALASVPPLQLDAIFGPADGVAAWGDAIRARQALGRELASASGVSPRMLTNGERTYYASQLEQPDKALRLVSGLVGAVGERGAADFLRELGGKPDANATMLHLADLSIGGSSFADRAVRGMALKGTGATLSKDDAAALDKAFVQVDPAVRTVAGVKGPARNVAELAMMADRAQGIDRPAAYYVRSALGATATGGRTYGGPATVNGGQTIAPRWLDAEQMDDALLVFARAWQAKGLGPVHSNGQPASPESIARLRPVLMPNGRYRLRTPQGTWAPARNGKPFEVDFDAGRDFLRGQLGAGAVMPPRKGE